ncbi:MAG: hypothetical protein QOD92_480 [Acidimicrobiaceae bacterium]|jgi:hypothetical protein
MAMPWQPAGVAAVVGLAVVASTPGVGDDPGLRLRIVGIAMAAALAFVLDDRAAATLASSPVTLIERRALRLGLVLPLAALWWIGIVGVVSARRVAPLPSTSLLALELAMYSALGFAGCVWSQRRSDDGSGGATGAATVAMLALAGVLPLPSWWPLAHSGSGGASLRLQLVLTFAIAALVLGSLDPSTGRALRNRRQATGA